MYEAVTKTDWYKENNDPGFVSRCDFCGKVDDTFYYFPELGHKVECEECATEHMKHVKWYTEDLHVVFNSLITWVITYDIGWTQNDLRIIDEFFSSKGHHSLHIETFIKKYRGDGYVQ